MCMFKVVSNLVKLQSAEMLITKPQLPVCPCRMSAGLKKGLAIWMRLHRSFEARATQTDRYGGFRILVGEEPYVLPMKSSNRYGLSSFHGFDDSIKILLMK
jgi:hypothetical protein